MKKRKIIYGAIIAFFMSQATALAEGLPWLDQQYPYDFIFGNHIDTHQQTMVLPDGTLKGVLYIEFTGEYTPEGYPIAEHTDCFKELSECTVGWKWEGVPGKATFVYHESGDHPLWLVESRNDIPQPGGYSHFHWLDGTEKAMDLMVNMEYEGYFLELTAKDTFVFKHGKDEILITPGLDLSSHLNLVSIFPTSTTPEDGGGDHTTH
jgi:hypothetical protein